MSNEKQEALDELTRALLHCQQAGLKVFAIPRMYPFENEAGAVIRGVTFDGKRYLLEEKNGQPA